MFNSTVLEIAIGLVFVYLVLSLVCTSVNEYIAQFLNLRAETLYQAIHGMFDGKDAARIAEDIYNHAVIRGLGRKRAGERVTPAGNTVFNRAKPSYIAPSAFSMAVTDLIGLSEPVGAQLTVRAQAFTNALAGGPRNYDKEVIDTLRPLINAANESLDQARRNIEKWYDDAMERASGWYKKKTQIMTFFVCLTVATVVNADTLMIVDRLWANPAQRTQIDAAAKNLNAGTKPEDAGKLDRATKDAALGLVGWKPNGTAGDPRALPQDANGWTLKLVGLLITAFAASLGAPFWFDTLNKIMNIRSAGASPNEKPTKDGAPAAERNRIHSSDSPLHSPTPQQPPSSAPGPGSQSPPPQPAGSSSQTSAPQSPEQGGSQTAAKTARTTRTSQKGQRQ